MQIAVPLLGLKLSVVGRMPPAQGENCGTGSLDDDATDPRRLALARKCFSLHLRVERPYHPPRYEVEVNAMVDVDKVLKHYAYPD